MRNARVDGKKAELNWSPRSFFSFSTSFLFFSTFLFFFPERALIPYFPFPLRTPSLPPHGTCRENAPESRHERHSPLPLTRSRRAICWSVGELMRQQKTEKKKQEKKQKNKQNKKKTNLREERGMPYFRGSGISLAYLSGIPSSVAHVCSY